MKKFNFLSMFVLIGAVLLSVTSCQKDFGDDIDKLKEQVASLENAVKAGKLVKSVEATSTGFKITYSDNTTSDVAVTGTAGATGFAPVIGIDSEGYWTVITTQGGTAVRMKDAGGKDIKAVPVAPSIGTNGNWYIGTTDTGVKAQGPAGPAGPGGSTADVYLPKINTDAAAGTVGNWFFYDSVAKKYVDSNIPSGTTPITEVKADGYLYINGVKTSIGGPAVVINDVTGVVTITQNGKTYTLATVDGGATNNIQTTMIRSIANPGIYSGARMIVGIIKGDATHPLTWKKHSGVDTTWIDGAVTTKDKEYRLPLIVNPTTANLEPADLKLVNAKGVKAPINITTIEKDFTPTEGGYLENPFITKATSSPSTGLVTVNFKADNVVLHSQMLADGNYLDYTYLAFKAHNTADNNDVFTSYTYVLKVEEAPTVTLANQNFKVSIGSGFNLLENVLAKIKAAGDADAIAENVMFSKWKLDPLDQTSVDLAHLILDNTKDGKTFSTKEDEITLGALEGTTIKFLLTTKDWNGFESTCTVSVQFYVTFQGTVFNYPANTTHTLDAVNKTFDLLFEPVWTRISVNKKYNDRTEYWSKWASILHVEYYKSTDIDANGKVINSAAPVTGFSSAIYPAGITQAQQIAANDLSDKPWASGQQVKPYKFVFNVDPSIVIPGDYKAIFTFEDPRNYANNETMWGLPDVGDSTMFRTVINIKVQNPSPLFASVSKKPANFWPFGTTQIGDTMRVYGTVEPFTSGSTVAGQYAQGFIRTSYTSSVAVAVGNDGEQRYNLPNGFNNLTEITNNPNIPSTLSFEMVTPTLPVANLNYIADDSLWMVQALAIDANNLYKKHKVRMMATLFGNPLNKVEVINANKVSPFWVESRSEIFDGRFDLKTTGKTIAVRTAIQGAAVKMSDIYKMSDTYWRSATDAKNEVDLFKATARDLRVKSVTITKDGTNQYATWLDITPSGNDFIFQTNNASQQISADVKVPCTLTVTDIYGMERTMKFDVTIKQ